MSIRINQREGEGKNHNGLHVIIGIGKAGAGIKKRRGGREGGWEKKKCFRE